MANKSKTKAKETEEVKEDKNKKASSSKDKKSSSTKKKSSSKDSASKTEKNPSNKKTTPATEKKAPSTTEKKSSNKRSSSSSKKTEESESKVVVKQVSKEDSVFLAEDNSTDRLTELAMLISGEKKLQQDQEELRKLKEEAKKDQKDKMRKDIRDREVVLAVDPEYKPNEIEATGGAVKVVQKINLYKWEAPIRIQFPFDTKTFTIVVVISLVFILYLAVLGHYGLMFSIIALLFFLYVAGTTEALNVTHYITTRGIDSLDKLYEWYMLGNFRFTKKNDQYMLIVETRLRTPVRLIMLLDKDDMTPIFLLLQDKLLYKDIRKQRWLDKATYGEYIPIEEV